MSVNIKTPAGCKNIFTCLAGSRAYGLDHPDSDYDYRFVFLENPESFWSVSHKPETQVQSIEKDMDYQGFELAPFCGHLLRGNITVLEWLFAQNPLLVGEEFLPLLKMRREFLSIKVCNSLQGYAVSQKYRWADCGKSNEKRRNKFAMHCFRLLLTGISLLETGDLLVNVSEHRELLLRIKAGEIEDAELEELYQGKMADFDTARKTSPLTSEPPYAKVDEYLKSVRREQLRKSSLSEKNSLDNPIWM